MLQGRVTGPSERYGCMGPCGEADGLRVPGADETGQTP